MKKSDDLEGLDLDDFDSTMASYIKDIASNIAARKMHAREKIVGMGEEAAGKSPGGEVQVFRFGGPVVGDAAGAGQGASGGGVGCDGVVAR